MDSTVTQNILSVNFHLTDRCNLRCKYCYSHFARAPQGGNLSFSTLCSIIRQLKDAGVEKLNFASGEPMLHPFLGELIEYSYSMGIKTSIVTNGTLFTKEWLNTYGPFLNWIGISCDSSDESVQKHLGRGSGFHVNQTLNTFAIIHSFNRAQIDQAHRIRTKLNTVVTRLNWQENMADFVRQCGIERWKVFQMLCIAGENEGFYTKATTTKRQFETFVNRHQHLQKEGVILVPEDNEIMKESYVMIDPWGRFFQNKDNSYIWSQPIYEVEVHEALEQVGFSEEKFFKRGGLYNY